MTGQGEATDSQVVSIPRHRPASVLCTPFTYTQAGQAPPEQQRGRGLRSGAVGLGPAMTSFQQPPAVPMRDQVGACPFIEQSWALITQFLASLSLSFYSCDPSFMLVLRQEQGRLLIRPRRSILAPPPLTTGLNHSTSGTRREFFLVFGPQRGGNHYQSDLNIK